MSARSTAIATAIALTACGRVGFEEHTGQSQTPPVDAPRPQDAVVPTDGPAICMQPAPFLRLVDVIGNGNGSTYTAVYCYSGLAGPLTASMRHSSDGGVFTEITVPIDAGAADLYIGSADCSACFIRLEANGVIEDGPSTDFIGD